MTDFYLERTIKDKENLQRKVNAALLTINLMKQ